MIKYSDLIKNIEKARKKTGLKDPMISISTFISESEFIHGDDIQINTTSTFGEKSVKGIDISINYKETKNLTKR